MNNEIKLRHQELRIDVKESWDLNYWCGELNVRAEELKEIIKIVGPSVSEIRLYLAKKFLITWPGPKTY